VAEKEGASDPDALLSSLDEDAADFEPLRFDLSNSRDRSAFRELFSSARPPLVRSDRLRSQVRELVRSRSPEYSSVALDDATERFLEEHGRETYGSWVYYPWRRTLVRVLSKLDFVELRTSRFR
jgi:hypothetical protein